MARFTSLKTSTRIDGLFYEMVWDSKYQCYAVDGFASDGECYDEGVEIDTMPETRDDAQALVVFDAWVEYQLHLEHNKGVKPDWEAQARYDEAHGTVNGQDPRIAEWNELVGAQA
jgi:hypothetical protein